MRPHHVISCPQGGVGPWPPSVSAAQDVVTFPDVAVNFSLDEWSCLDSSQRKLYRDVMLDTYQLLIAIGHCRVKPALISWLEGRALGRLQRGVFAECRPQVQDLTFQQFASRMGSSNRSEKGNSQPQSDKSDAVMRDIDWREPCCLYPNGNEDSGDICSRGKQSEDSVLAEELPTTGHSAPESAPPNPSWQQAHEQIPHAMESPKCKQCGEAFPCVQHHDVLLDTFSAQRPSDCQQGGHALSQPSHPRARKKVRTRKKRHVCQECGKAFTYPSLLVVHMNIHTGERPYACEECGKSFAKSSCLSMHKKIHTGEKPYTCQECGKAFLYSSHLKRHWNIHTEEKPYACKECGKTFIQYSQLFRHRIFHTKEKAYKCTECGKSFTRATYFLNHWHIHTGEKPYTCVQCGKAFTRSSSLINHWNTHTELKS